MQHSKPSLHLSWAAALAVCATGCFVDRSAIDPAFDAGGSRDAGGSADGQVIEPDGGEERDAGGRDACSPRVEFCNGEDDDCDGMIDEAVTEACSTDCGDGVRTCSDGSLGDCDAPVPGVETCNDMDDDCDGTMDEDLSRACSSACGGGTETCQAGLWTGCDAPAPGVETCNGMDDDCDGMTDEALSRACSSACGTGTETCSGGLWGGCSAPAPGVETCNGTDDDCDGMTDELLPRMCTNACGATGTETCVGGSWGACTALVGTETCNGIDDDCDGMIDDGVCTCSVRYNAGRTYLFCNTRATWVEARDACRAVGYDLVTIESTPENTWVASTALAIADFDWWIGLADRDYDGTHVWSSGSTSSHRQWMAGEPGGGCVALLNGSGTETRAAWADDGCNSDIRYVCEVP